MTDPSRADAAPPSSFLIGGYALGNLGLAVFLSAPSLLLLFFLTDILRIPAAMAGLVVMLPKIWEVVFDPFVGFVSDRRRGRLGRRWPLMAIGAIGFPIAFAALFAPPAALGRNDALIWVLVAYLAASTSYALYSIPYATMPGEITQSQPVRTGIVAWRVAFLALGLMMAGGISPLIVEAAGGGRHGYSVMSVALAVMAGFALAASLYAVWKLQDRTSAALPVEPVRHTLGAAWRATASNPAYRLLWIGYAFQTLAMGAHAAMTPYFVTYRLDGGAGLIAQLFVAAGITQVLAMPVWVRIADRVGAPRAAMLAAIFYAGGLALNLPLGAGDVAWATLFAIIAGFGAAGCYVLPFALMPGVLAVHSPAESRAHAGLLTAIWVAGEKLGLALGGAAVGVLLGQAGYSAGSAEHGSEAGRVIPLLFALLPAVMLAISLPFFRSLARRHPPS